MPPPAVIIIVRHGARLDAADKQWHLSSPTPYDPPLTYGGWTQCRALGTRIASLLHAREDELAEALESNPPSASPPRGSPPSARNGSAAHRMHDKDAKVKRRKHKVIIHSSPFLRCVQTSVAISAGIAQYDEAASNRTSRQHPRSSQKAARSNSPLAAIQEPYGHSRFHGIRQALHHAPQIHKTPLRIDAFLGEWLSPDYFDLITPPPNSTMMVAGAKADLLRRGDYVDAPQATPHKGHFPGGWAKTNSNSNSKGAPEETAIGGLSTLAQALPLRERASSHSSVGSTGSRSSHRGTAFARPESGLYTAPVPSYAVSPSDPIPRGYVAHARDACVDVDYQWDSMREPQNWGDGGEYGEEWSAMHKRFRKGLNSMVEWYKEHGSDDHATEQWACTDDNKDREEGGDESDLVLVLVTHGAGCNALIGALTNQPVLLDVGMASLTMAVLRDHAHGRRSSSPSVSQRSAVHDSHLSELYEMRLVASTEHLRPGVDPAKLAHLPSPKVVPITDPFLPRRRYFNNGAHSAAGSPVDAPFNLGEPIRPGHSMSAALGSIRRNSTTPSSSATRAYSPSGSTSGLAGLWSKPPAVSTVAAAVGATALDGVSETSREATQDSRDVSPATKPLPENAEPPTPEIKRDEEEMVRPKAPTPNPSAANIGRSLSQHGLWGSKPLGLEDRHERERGPKRRWTVNERDG